MFHTTAQWAIIPPCGKLRMCLSSAMFQAIYESGFYLSLNTYLSASLLAVIINKNTSLKLYNLVISNYFKQNEGCRTNLILSQLKFPHK